MQKFITFMVLSFTLVWAGCNKDTLTNDPTTLDRNSATGSSQNTTTVEFRGKLQKLEVTSFMYGTHVISNENKRYALKSSTVNLDLFTNQTVTVKGTKIAGYPVDGGPEYLLVTEVLP